jgi:hypothetical protein
MMSASSVFRAGPALLLLLAVSACDVDDFCGPHDDHVVGSGRVVTEVRPVASFDAVSLSGVGRLFIQQTGSESLEVTAEDNVLEVLRSDVVGGRLVLGPEPGTSISNHREIEYRLTVAELNELEVSGACEVEVEGLRTDLLRVWVSGSSRVAASGVVDRQELVFSGASGYRGEALASRAVRLDVSGVSALQVRVSETLEGSASGVSVVEYYGRPAVRVSISGASVVRQAGD